MKNGVAHVQRWRHCADSTPQGEYQESVNKSKRCSRRWKSAPALVRWHRLLVVPSCSTGFDPPRYVWLTFNSDDCIRIKWLALHHDSASRQLRFLHLQPRAVISASWVVTSKCIATTGLPSKRLPGESGTQRNFARAVHAPGGSISVELVERLAGKFPSLVCASGTKPLALRSAANHPRSQTVSRKTSQIHHDGKNIFRQVAGSLHRQPRYHSLIVEKKIPASRVDDHCGDRRRIIMGFVTASQDRRCAVPPESVSPESAASSSSRIFLSLVGAAASCAPAGLADPFRCRALTNSNPPKSPRRSPSLSKIAPAAKFSSELC